MIILPIPSYWYCIVLFSIQIRDLGIAALHCYYPNYFSVIKNQVICITNSQSLSSKQTNNEKLVMWYHPKEAQCYIVLRTQVCSKLGRNIIIAPPLSSLNVSNIPLSELTSFLLHPYLPVCSIPLLES